jgi:hypothetical protein
MSKRETVGPPVAYSYHLHRPPGAARVAGGGKRKKGHAVHHHLHRPPAPGKKK